MTTIDEAMEALYSTGHWLLGQERFRDAAEVFRAMATAKPEDERAWLGLGQAHEGAKHTVIANEMYVTGVTLAKSGRCAVALARLLRDHGKDGEASESIDYAESIARDNEDEALAALVAYERGQS